jgi:hypothetical protein
VKVYVATSFQNIPEARAVMQALQEAGHTITHDWTREKIDPAWSQERQEQYLQQCGSRDFDGVERADVLVLINHSASRDAMAEFGMALGRDQLVYVLYPDRRTSVFFHKARLCSSVPQLLNQLR